MISFSLASRIHHFIYLHIWLSVPIRLNFKHKQVARYDPLPVHFMTQMHHIVRDGEIATASVCNRMFNKHENLLPINAHVFVIFDSLLPSRALALALARPYAHIYFDLFSWKRVFHYSFAVSFGAAALPQPTNGNNKNSCFFHSRPIRPFIVLKQKSAAQSAKCTREWM